VEGGDKEVGKAITSYSLNHFNELIDNAGKGYLVVACFFANWISTCKKMVPVVLALSESHEDVLFIKVDVDKNKPTGKEYSVTNLPTFLFFKNGEKIDELEGAEEDKLKKMIDHNK
jgi:thioredoxin 1